jgi:hypothetical protein
MYSALGFNTSVITTFLMGLGLFKKEWKIDECITSTAQESGVTLKQIRHIKVGLLLVSEKIKYPNHQFDVA